MSKLKRSDFVNFVNDHLLTLMTGGFKPDLKDMFKTSDIDDHCPDLESAFLNSKKLGTYLKPFETTWMVSNATLLSMLMWMLKTVVNKLLLSVLQQKNSTAWILMTSLKS